MPGKKQIVRTDLIQLTDQVAMRNRTVLLTTGLLVTTALSFAQPRHKVIINQDCSGPGGSNLQTVAVMIQSPEVEVLGITVVSGDQWRDEEVAHALRLLEIIGRTDIPVVAGAVFPLVRRREETELWQERYGKVVYAGAWDDRWWHEPFVVPQLPEGQPSTKPADEDAAHFLIRMVHQYPHQISIYAGGPLTNLALATRIDSQFPTLAQELVVMGGSANPGRRDPEFSAAPRREFNFWFDPEAAHIVLCAPWHKITVTTVDISITTRFTKEMIAQIAKANTPVAQYIEKYADEEYMWDELAAAAWLDPAIITKEETVYMDIDISHGASYGNTLTWAPGNQPALGEQLVHMSVDLNRDKFYRMFIDLMTRATPGARASAQTHSEEQYGSVN
jgi:purine nucleosidase